MLFREIANECKRDEKLKDIAASITRTRSSRTMMVRTSPALQQHQPTRDGDSGKQVRQPRTRGATSCPPNPIDVSQKTAEGVVAPSWRAAL